MDKNSIYDRIRAGETVAVRTKPCKNVNGEELPINYFSIECEKSRWGFYVYSAIRNGRRMRGYNRMILDVETARDWCLQLEEDSTTEGNTPT